MQSTTVFCKLKFYIKKKKIKLLTSSTGYLAVVLDVFYFGLTDPLHCLLPSTFFFNETSMELQ